jgi:hypothetical protein
MDRTARLRELAGEPDEQAVFALRVFETGRNAEESLAALDVLARRPGEDLRAALLRRYGYLDAKGVRRDPGGAVRAAILHALRPMARREDAALLERAVTTYEFLYGEAAGGLRAAGLLVLDEVDDALAGFHAVRLLTDQYTDIMSGEPALTAVRVLSAQDQLLPLYAYVSREGEGVGDVVAESLRSLTALPASLLPALAERYAESRDELVLLGLFDLLLAHPARREYIERIFAFLEETRLLNIYRYLASALVAERNADTIQRLERMARGERDPAKQGILDDALSLR